LDKRAFIFMLVVCVQLLMWLNFFRVVTVEFKWRFGLEIEILTTDSLFFFSNYLNRSEFELDENSQSEVLEATECCASVWYWMDTWRECDLRDVGNWAVQFAI